MKELERYLEKGIYNSDIGDVCVSRPANVTGANIDIYQHLNGRILQTTHEPSCHPDSQSTVPKTIHLLRTGSEYIPGNSMH